MSVIAIVGIPLGYKGQNMFFLYEEFKCFFFSKIIIQYLRTQSILDWITKIAPVDIIPRILYVMVQERSTYYLKYATR